MLNSITSLRTLRTIALFASLVLSSCSLEKKIARSASADVLKAKALETAHIGISIYEPATGKYWYNYQGDKYFIPASNTKIPTCYAAMKYLGDSLVGLEYEIRPGQQIIAIRGTGDPTFMHPDYKSQPVLDLLKKYKNIIISDQPMVDMHGSGWAWNDYKEYYMAQRSTFPLYGNIVKFDWTDKQHITATPRYFSSLVKINDTLAKGFNVYKPWDKNEFTFVPGNAKTDEVPFTPDMALLSQLLTDTLKTNGIGWMPSDSKLPAKIFSQPTDSLLKPMMHRSDNFFAEQSLLMVGRMLTGILNDDLAIDTLLKTDFKDLPQKPRWADGSGLSRYNLFTPQDMVAILNKMTTEFGMERIKVIFPTGGEGTISSYYKSENGYIYAKTGTLSGVVALSGFLTTKKNKELIFSVLVNNHQASATDVRRAVEKFLQGIRNSW